MIKKVKFFAAVKEGRVTKNVEESEENIIVSSVREVLEVRLRKLVGSTMEGLKKGEVGTERRQSLAKELGKRKKELVRKFNESDVDEIEAEVEAFRVHCQKEATLK